MTQVNQAEAEFWKRNSGERVGWSDEILGFDCGGQQWVLETAFPIGTLEELQQQKSGSSKDIRYIEDLLKEIETSRVPAHAPIEQRWTATSSSAMSPASDKNPKMVHSWVGVIMYLPTEDEQQRHAITQVG